VRHAARAPTVNLPRSPYPYHSGKGWFVCQTSSSCRQQPSVLCASRSPSPLCLTGGKGPSMARVHCAGRCGRLAAQERQGRRPVRREPYDRFSRVDACVTRQPTSSIHCVDAHNLIFTCKNAAKYLRIIGIVTLDTGTGSHRARQMPPQTGPSGSPPRSSRETWGGRVFSQGRGNVPLPRAREGGQRAGSPCGRSSSTQRTEGDLHLALASWGRPGPLLRGEGRGSTGLWATRGLLACPPLSP
jgi:hypothetical protein